MTTSIELKGLDLSTARKLLDNRDISSVELTKSYLDRIANVEPSVSSFVTVTEETALAQAARADEPIASGDSGI